jgi:hypothetical protein
LLLLLDIQIINSESIDFIGVSIDLLVPVYQTSASFENATFENATGRLILLAFSYLDISKIRLFLLFLILCGIEIKTKSQDQIEFDVE